VDAQCNKLATVEQLHNTAVVNVPWRKKEKSQLNSEMWPVFLCVASVLTMAADDQSEISFLIPQGTLLWQPISVGFVHRTDGRRWTQAASGAAGRANVGLRPASSFFLISRDIVI